MATEADAVPPGVAAEDKGPAIIISMSALTAIATVFLAARLYVRAGILGRVHWDDYLITVSLLFGWVYTAMTIVGVHHGDGKHTAVLTEQQQLAAHFWTIIGFAPAIMSFGFPKLAVVALLTRLLSPERAHLAFLWFMAIMTQLNLIVNMAILYTQCLPTASMWDSSITNKHCRDGSILVGYALYAACFSAAVDFYLAVYPAIVLFHLQMPLRKKLGLSVALGFGSIATIVATYKCTRLWSLASPDFSYDTADLVIWTSIESNTLVIAACIPILQPLMDCCLGRHRRSPTPGASHGNRFSRYYGASSPVRFERPFAFRGRHRGEFELGSEAEMEKNLSDGSMFSSESEIRRPDGILRTDVITVSYDERRPNSRPSSRSHPAQWRPNGEYSRGAAMAVLL